MSLRNLIEDVKHATKDEVIKYCLKAVWLFVIPIANAIWAKAKPFLVASCVPFVLLYFCALSSLDRAGIVTLSQQRKAQIMAIFTVFFVLLIVRAVSKLPRSPLKISPVAQEAGVA